MAGQSKYDWEAIFNDYRIHVLSVRDVAKKHGVDKAYMLRQVKKHGIERDLSSRVKEAVDSKLVTGLVPRGDKQSEDQIVENASNQVVGVIESHREDIKTTRIREQELLIELACPKKPYKVTKTKKNGDQEVIWKNAPVSTLEKSMTLNNLTSIQVRRIGLERQAYGLNDLNDPNSNLHTVDTIYIDPGEHIVTMDGKFVNGDGEDGQS